MEDFIIRSFPNSTDHAIFRPLKWDDDYNSDDDDEGEAESKRQVKKTKWMEY